MMSFVSKLGEGALTVLQTVLIWLASALNSAALGLIHVTKAISLDEGEKYNWEDLYR